MPNNSLLNLRFENIKTIFNCIAPAKNISRAEISEKTNLSLVTVGKVVDALASLGIVKQTKAPRPVVGRRAAVVNVNKTSFLLIFDLTSYNFRCTVLDLTLTRVDDFYGRYDTLTSYPDNLSLFINRAKGYVYKKYGMENCIGIGVSLPGVYDTINDCARSPRIPEIVALPVRAFFEKHFSDTIVYVESNSIAAARSNITNVSEYDRKDIMYWYIGDRNVSGAHFISGELAGGRGNTACDFGRMIFDIDLTLEERIALCKNEQDCAELLSGVLYNMIRVISPDSFIMEYDMRFPTDRLTETIVSILIQKYKLPKEHIPEFNSANKKIKNSYLGLANFIRDKWLKQIIFEKNN